MRFENTFIIFWIYFWHISLIKQSRNIYKNLCLLELDRKCDKKN